jgi:hypothetical protein
MGAAGALDLEASEWAVRAGMHGVGAALRGTLLNSAGASVGADVLCAAGHRATFVDYRSKEITTVLGAVEFRRAIITVHSVAPGSCRKMRRWIWPTPRLARECDA